MASAMLRKFGLRKEHRESDARIQLQKELFAYTKCVDHGFPHKPSAFAYDPKLKLFAIGTKTGAVKVYGAPGVEFASQHKEDVSVTQLFFLPEQGRLVSLCGDNSLHLWEINLKDDKSVLEEVKEFSMESSKLKNISACCLTAEADYLLMGTEGGNIHQLDVKSFSLMDHIIYQDVVMQKITSVPDDFKVNPGAVESIAQHPTQSSKFLIGYNRGLIVLWDNQENNADQTYNATQQLESLTWHRNGTDFMSAHADGSYIIWTTEDSSKPKEQATTPYGPFPCKAISKIEWKTAKADPFIIFSGGMPRASYGDRHTVSIQQGSSHVVLDFTSRVVDFILLNYTDDVEEEENRTDYDEPHTLLVLTEEELVAIDLVTDGWPTFKLPYLASMHSSAITCAHHVSNIPEQLWNKIVDAGEMQMSGMSIREWPIMGGKNRSEGSSTRDLMLTGHEDGTVRFWDASTISFRLLYKLNTSNIFGGELEHNDHNNADAEDEWPPFRKVGTFDPYSDDPRLGIQKISMCPFSETLVVGGTAGQVVILQMEREERTTEVKSVLVNVVSDRDNFVWKGHEALHPKEGEEKFSAGFQPSCIMQLSPPAACTALALQPEWQLVAAGTAHGFGLFDYVQKKSVVTKCTLNPSDLTGTGESAMSRRKSFKKSLRESFRRLRKRREDRQKKAAAAKHTEEKPAEKSEAKPETSGEQPAAAAESPKEEIKPAESPAAEGAAAPAPAAAAPAATTPTESKPVERAIEARSADDSMASMVRALYFADTFLVNAQTHTPTLWVGVNSGAIYVFTITLPANDKRDSEEVRSQLGKEIQLKHRAPVIAISIMDRNQCPLPAPLSVQHEQAKAADMTGNHHVLICSEEQFKVFSLPNLKANNKYKLTAHEGSRVRRVGFVNFRSKSGVLDANYNEFDVACLTNQGDLQIFTFPGLRRQIQSVCIKKENITGISSCIFSSVGQGYYLGSPSEFIRFSLSARFVSEPQCEVELKECMRPPPPEPEPEQPAAAEEGATAEGGDAAAATEGTEDITDGVAKASLDDTAATDSGQDTTVDEPAADMTQDSVKVHLNLTEETETKTEEGVAVESTTEATTTVVRTVTTVVTTMETTDQPPAEGEPDNLPDDTKLKSTEETSETTVTTVKLEELKITEDGDLTTDKKQIQEEEAKEVTQATA